MVIILGVAVPSLTLVAYRLTEPRIYGVEAPADVEALRHMVSEQQIAVQRLQRERLFMSIALCSAIAGATIGFVLLQNATPAGGREGRAHERAEHRSG